MIRFISDACLKVLSKCATCTDELSPFVPETFNGEPCARLSLSVERSPFCGSRDRVTGAAEMKTRDIARAKREKSSRYKYADRARVSARRARGSRGSATDGAVRETHRFYRFLYLNGCLSARRLKTARGARPPPSRNRNRSVRKPYGEKKKTALRSRQTVLLFAADTIRIAARLGAADGFFGKTFELRLFSFDAVSSTKPRSRHSPLFEETVKKKKSIVFSLGTLHCTAERC